MESMLVDSLSGSAASNQREFTVSADRTQWQAARTLRRWLFTRLADWPAFAGRDGPRDVRKLATDACDA